MPYHQHTQQLHHTSKQSGSNSLTYIRNKISDNSPSFLTALEVNKCSDVRQFHGIFKC